ncbi:MAG: hypothetical protein KIT31_37745 [Deltaproteobacteria bacterium]|nr:hypothetical protein [Deltaproteobacteria bacterium]
MDMDTPEADPALEWKLRAVAVPVAFALAVAFNRWETGHWLQRTFLTMIPHELGHALVGWWSGYAAVPGLWKTSIPEVRSLAPTVLVGALEAAGAYVGWRANRTWLMLAAVALAAAQLLATTASATTSHLAITFGGDAGAMVIGTALVCCFFVGEDSRLRRGGLRWGLLVIGAAAYVDTAATWWRARTDRDVIPFGEIEGVGRSDPSRLVEDHGWTTAQLVDRYVVVVGLCALVVAAAYAWGVYDARRRARGAGEAPS